ncbi:hypothetical protein AAF712_015200 [Marasmius tenuissimus]|uniref:Uncharacterized protein n=1 Tax=Marasmius tenuissimus TaxID=585030 RepID=A0ABR2ZAW6_9AGAR
MTSPYPYTPRSTSSSSSYASSSPSWSSSSSPWPSGPPSSSPPMTPTSQHAYTTAISSPTPYFTYMNARYDSSIGRERELQRELERERESYHKYKNRKGKFVEREPEYRRDPPRQPLPSFREAFGDIEPLNLVPPRNTYSSHSSSSTTSSSSLSSYSLSPPMAKASPAFQAHSYMPIRDTPTKRPSKYVPENVFYSSDEEEDADYFRRRRRPFRSQPEPEPSLTEHSISDDEDEHETQNTYTFSPERRRSTTFETSSERGLWTISEPKPITTFPSAFPAKRSSEPVIPSLPSTSQQPLPRNPARHVSEPVIDSDEVWPRHGSTFMDRDNESTPGDKDLPLPVSPPVANCGRSPSLPSSPPPMSPISSISPVACDEPALLAHLDSSNVDDGDSGRLGSVLAEDVLTSDSVSLSPPLGDVAAVGPADCDIVMGDNEAGDDVSHDASIDCNDPSNSLQHELCDDSGDYSGRDDEDMTLAETTISSATVKEVLDLPSDPQLDEDNDIIDEVKTETDTEAVDIVTAPPASQIISGTSAVSADDGAMSEDLDLCLAGTGLPLSLSSPSPLSSVPSSRRTTPCLDDLIYAMEMEEETARAKMEEARPKEEPEDREQALASVADELFPTQTPVPNITVSASTAAPTPNTKTPATTALATSKAAHTNGVQKRTVPASSGSSVEPPLKKRRCEEPTSLAQKSPSIGPGPAPGKTSLSDSTFFSKTKPHSHVHHRSGPGTSRPVVPTSPTSRVVVRVISRTVPTVKVAKVAETSASRLGKPSAVGKKSDDGVKSKLGRGKEREKGEDVHMDEEDGPAKTKTTTKKTKGAGQAKSKPANAKAKSQPQKPSIVKKTSTAPSTRVASKPVTLSPARSRMVIESDSESDSDDDDLESTKQRSFSSPLSSPVSSDAEDDVKGKDDDDHDTSSEEDGSDESEDDDDESGSEEERPRKLARQRVSVKSTKSKPSSRSKPLSKSKVPPKPLPPLDSRDAEIIGILIETIAQSRASSHTVTVLYRSIAQSRPTVLARLAEGHYVEPDQDMDEDGEDEERVKGRGRGRGKGEAEQEWWMREFVRVMELGMLRCGMFGRVESSGKESLDRALDAHYFYIPERDEDQERATLIKSIMPRAGKRTETKKYKQYYWKPVEGKTLKWDAVDGI